jgi:glycosyltransferase involved in cell wall biosynthesis
VDAAVVIGPKAGGLSLLWAMGANVPIVGQATHAISEIVEDRHSALLAPPHDGPALAHRLQRLLGDRQLAWSLRDTARHEAFSFFSRQRYCRDLTEVYRQAIDGEPVSVPEMEITGGMRFAGRG